MRCSICNHEHPPSGTTMASIFEAHGIQCVEPVESCRCGEPLHDVDTQQVSVSKMGGDDRKITCTTPPWYTIDQIHGLFRINQPSMRARLQDGMWQNWGHKTTNGQWLVHADDLLKMVVDDSNTTL